MNAAIERLLDAVATDPLPEAYTSSHWQHYGRETVVERRGDRLVLQAAGFPDGTRTGVARSVLQALERLSFRKATRGVLGYPSVWRAARRLAHDLRRGLGTRERIATTALAVLTDHLCGHGLELRTIVMIGDGDGFLGALVRRRFPGITLYCVDLPKMLVFQARTHELADPAATMSVLDPDRPAVTDVVFVLPPATDAVPAPIDCAIDIACMQEMNAFAAASVFAFLRRRSSPRSRFYSVNRAHKRMPGGEVATFADYPWRDDDEVFIDGPCPYYTHFLSGSTHGDGPRVLGVRVPLVNYYDGPVMHRLVRLAPTS